MTEPSALASAAAASGTAPAASTKPEEISGNKARMTAASTATAASTGMPVAPSNAGGSHVGGNGAGNASLMVNNLTWEKLSPAEFQQLQDFAACKSLYYLYDIFSK